MSATRFFATKALQTQLGRTVMVDALPDELQTLIDVAKSAVIKHTSKEAAKEMKKDLLVIMVKLQLMVENHTLIVEDSNVDKITLLTDHAYSLINYFRSNIVMLRDDSKELKRAAHAAAASVNACGELSLQILATHMKPSNLAKISNICSTFADTNLLMSFMTEFQYEPERQRLENVLSSVFGSVARLQGSLPCADAEKCHRHRLIPNESFSGSRYCGFHHYRQFHELTTTPTLEKWLKRDDLVLLLQPFCGVELIAFRNALMDYSQTERQNSRVLKARTIIKKYITTSSSFSAPSDRKMLEVDEQMRNDGTLLDSEIVAFILQKIEEVDVGRQLSKNLFEKALASINEKLDDIFRNKFLHSEEYLTWQAKTAVPLAELEELKPWIQSQRDNAKRFSAMVRPRNRKPTEAKRRLSDFTI